jgi:hypothetical protein
LNEFLECRLVFYEQYLYVIEDLPEVLSDGMAFGLVEIYHCSNILFQSQNFHLTILLPKLLPENDLNMNLAHLVDEEFKQLFLKIGKHFVDNLLVGKGLQSSLKLELDWLRDENFLYAFQDKL